MMGRIEVIEKEQIMDVINWMQVEPGVYSAGQPQTANWQEIAAGGVKTVVNLRPLSEQPDESDDVESAGMKYLHLPIASPNAVTDEVAERLMEWVSANKADGVLVHCASGNRVGALFALGEFLQHGDVNAALQRGRQAGLTKLEPFVSQLLASKVN